jgi:hypothetical protein
MPTIYLGIFNNLSLIVKYYVLPHNLINFEELIATNPNE